MASVNGKRTGGSIKELTDSLHPNPLVVVKRYAFDPAYRRGSPLKKMRGLGVFFMGSGEEFPSGFGQSPRSFFLPRNTWLGIAEQRRRPLSILMR
jgi:hypothetical protein